MIGAVNELSDPRDVVVCAAGSMPGDLHKLWRTRDPKGYHVEYGYSCMGYEVAGGLGVAMACPDRDVFVMVGDGSYLMMATELATAVQEHVKIITVLVQNHGYASIGALSESLGSQRFGTRYRSRGAQSHRLDGDFLPVDLAANAASFGLEVIKAQTMAELADAIKVAKAGTEPVVIYVETDPFVDAPSSESWWDVPVSATSTLGSTQQARTTYEEHKARQRLFLTPPTTPPDPPPPTLRRLRARPRKGAPPSAWQADHRYRPRSRRAGATAACGCWSWRWVAAPLLRHRRRRDGGGPAAGRDGRVDGGRFELAGRPRVFPGHRLRVRPIESRDARPRTAAAVSRCPAPAASGCPPGTAPAAKVPVELRGAGPVQSAGAQLRHPGGASRPARSSPAR